jgi:hypothetical protein
MSKTQWYVSMVPQVLAMSAMLNLRHGGGFEYPKLRNQAPPKGTAASRLTPFRVVRTATSSVNQENR